ncbi:MAG: DUF2274 domain-containing protein [Sphingomonadales bacterium]|nr:DUF2274 domain-containing protein [Sphingomonadales bacterium]
MPEDVTDKDYRPQEPIPFMLEAFLEGDAAFKRARKERFGGFV